MISSIGGRECRPCGEHQANVIFSEARRGTGWAADARRGFFVLYSLGTAFIEEFGRMPRHVDPKTMEAIVKHFFALASSGNIIRARRSAADLEKQFLLSYIKAEKLSKGLEPNYSRDLQLAKEMAKKAKPGFHERSYALAASRLAQAMR